MNIDYFQKLTKHFYAGEFLIHAKSMPFSSWKGIIESFDIEIYENLSKLAQALENIRGFWDQPVNVLCGFRPALWDIEHGRSGSSLHCRGLAADFRIEGVPFVSVLNAIDKEIGVCGLAVNWKENYIHFDIRSEKVRWEY